MCRFMYEWIDEEESYCIFDDTSEPILESLEYLGALSTSKNDQENRAVALRLWFEFLEQLGLHFARAETKHIPEFMRWLKTPPHLRDTYKTVLQINPHIKSSTWNQYQSRVAHFYSKYVKSKYPECPIRWKEASDYNYYGYGHKEVLSFREQPTEFDPDTRSIPIETFKKIRAEVTNDRDALILDFTYIAGLRRGELSNIDMRQFNKVDRSKPTFKIVIHNSFETRHDNQTKTGSRKIFISSLLAERIGSYILHERAQPKQIEHYKIFTVMRSNKYSQKGDPLTGGYMSSIFKEAAKKAGFPKYTIHDCRHSMITNANSMGVPDKEIMSQAGHKSPNTTMKYRSKHAGVSEHMRGYCTGIYEAIRNQACLPQELS